MIKGADTRTLSAEVLMGYGNIKPDTLNFTLFCNQKWKYYCLFDENTHLKPKIYGYLVAIYCRDMKLSSCGNFDYPKFTSAEAFELFSRLVKQY